MAARSTIETLPDDVRRALDRRLLDTGFSDYAALAAWLQEQGFTVSRSAAHRYGQKFETRLARLRLATEQARVITESLGDDAGALGEALTAVAQEKTFQLLMDLDVEGQDISLDKLGTMISKLNATGVQQKRWAADMRARAAAAADAVETLVRQGGLSDDAAAQIRAKILGIAS